MMTIKRVIYRLGFRPKGGPFYSPSLSLIYAIKGAHYRGLTKELNR